VTGWVEQAIVGAGQMAGDQAAIVNASDADMNVCYQPARVPGV